MKILVPCKRVPSTDAPVRVRPDGAGIEVGGLAFVLNPFDAIALEEALRIRERGGAGGETSAEVLAVSIGDEQVESELRVALAMGADRALRVACEAVLDPFAVALTLAAVVRREQPDLVLMGKQAVDDDANQAGQMLAAILGWPQATFASEVSYDGAAFLRVARETDLGLETVRVGLPAVVTADLRLNEPRYASLPALMRAKKRPVESLPLEALGVPAEPRVRVVRLEQAAVERRCVRVDDAAELVRRLRQEAKVV